MMWLSPDALALLRTIEVHDVFADRSTVMVGLDFAQHCSTVLTWPQPSAIPWSQVQNTWNPAPFVPSGEDSTEWFQQWSGYFESSLDGFVKSQPAMKLTPQQREGSWEQDPTGCQECHTTSGQACVRLWFKQLRRFQSLLRSMRAANDGIMPAFTELKFGEPFDVREALSPTLHYGGTSHDSLIILMHHLSCPLRCLLWLSLRACSRASNLALNLLSHGTYANEPSS